MPFVKGKSGNPNGRKPGQLGVSKRERARLIAQSEVKPLSVMMEILAERWKAAVAAEDPETRKALQNESMVVAEKVAPYLHPKLQATTLKGETDNPLSFVMSLPSADELRRHVRGTEDQAKD